MEHRFAAGVCMAERLDAWPRFFDPAQWWLGAMLLLALSAVMVAAVLGAHGLLA